MKLLKKLLLIYVPGLLLGLALLTAAILHALDMLNEEGIDEALDFMSEHSVAEVYATVMGELGFVGAVAGDAAWGRAVAEGRGHAPWVMRSNLDGRPRMLNFALAPGLWASYDTGSGSLYRVWRGELNFEGAVYDYRHGPQPFSSGAVFSDIEGEDAWSLVLDGEAVPAQLQYLGHFYRDGQAQAGLRLRLSAAGATAVITEVPDIEGDEYLRTLQAEELLGAGGVELTFAGKSLRFGRDPRTLRTALGEPAPPPAAAAVTERGADAVEQGRALVAGSDCLSCHNETHQVVGPAFAAIGQRLGGSRGESVMSQLARSIVDGSVGRWGQVPMPPHPGLADDDARLMVAYILSLKDLEVEQDLPLDAQGRPYTATREYQVAPRLGAVHPAFQLQNIAPDGFQPKVGGMAFDDDGSLLLASWDIDGAVYRLRPRGSGEPWSVQRIAEGLHEPLGLAVAQGRLFVLQKQELTELVDSDGDGVIDEYLAHARDWPARNNFHSFAFGLAHRDGHLFAALSICVLPGGASCPEQLPNQGKVVMFPVAGGPTEYLASGLRTPNGVGVGADGQVFITDNQGDWLPASKLVLLRDGAFYGSRAVDFAGTEGVPEQPPVVWMPQDEIGNSPTQPMALAEGPYAGQLIYGDVFHGGIKRVSLDYVAGDYQGAVYRFSGGLQGGVNRLARGPDGAIYTGEIGNPGNWGEPGKKWFGVERLAYRGEPAFEILQVTATPTGMRLELTAPLAQGQALAPQQLAVRQWFYYPNANYGGPKYDEQVLAVESLQLSADRRTLEATIPGLSEGYVVYLHLDPQLRDEAGRTPWTHEAWYTLNAIPHDTQ